MPTLLGRLAAPDLVGEPRHVVLLACPNTSTLEIAGPPEVFALVAHKLREAGRLRARPYKVHLLAAQPGSLGAGLSGLQFAAEGLFDALKEPIDTLLVVGGFEVWNGRGQERLLQWLRDSSQRVRRLGSICTGAFLLGEAGLLDGHRVTTHWHFCERLAREYPALTVDPYPIFIRSGALSTAAGVTSGIDLALALVEEDLGADIAIRVARTLVLYVRRPGSESQISSALALQGSARLAFRDLPFWVLENLHRPLTVEDLAARVAMSVRNFARKFSDEFGQPPARFVAELRAETARRLLADSDKSRAAIAMECGFGSIDTMERALARKPTDFNLASAP